jgi:hypothetical protein
MPAPGKQPSELPLPTPLDPLCLQPRLLVAHVSKQAPGLQLPIGLGTPCLQQLLWFLVAHQQAGILNFLTSSRSPLPHTQVNPGFTLCYSASARKASLPTEYRSLVVTTELSCEKTLAAPSKSRNPAPPLSGNLTFCGGQETCFPKAQKGPALPTVSDHKRTPASLLKDQKH